MKRRLLLQAAGVIIAAGLAGCSTTSSGPRLAPERQISINAKTADVKASILSEFLGYGYTVTKDSEFVLAISRDSKNAGASFWLSSQYDGRVEERITFNIVGSEPTEVHWSAAFITNPGSGFERPTDITDNPSVDNVQAMLRQIKARLEAA